MRLLLAAAAAVPLLAASALAGSRLSGRTYEDLSDEAAELDGAIVRLHAGLDEARELERRDVRALDQIRKFQAAVEKAQASDADPKALAFLVVSGHYSDAADMRAKLPARREALEDDLRRASGDEKRLTLELSRNEAARKAFEPYLSKARAEQAAFAPLKREIDAYAADYQALKTRLAAGGLDAKARRAARAKLQTLPARGAGLEARVDKLTIPGYRDPAAEALEPALDTRRLLDALEKAEGGSGRNTR